MNMQYLWLYGKRSPNVSYSNRYSFAVGRSYHQATTNHTFAASLSQAPFWICTKPQEGLATIACLVLLSLHTSKQNV
ncbi:hypothetical protein WJX82_000324 [Trebouxia sp. C0006]